MYFATKWAPAYLQGVHINCHQEISFISLTNWEFSMIYYIILSLISTHFIFYSSLLPFFFRRCWKWPPPTDLHSAALYLTCLIGVAGSFSEGGQPFRPAKIQSLPAKIFSCQGGPSSPILFCHAKLLCQTVLPMGKLCRWMAAKQSKIEEKQENMVETNQKWQKTDKNDRKPWKMWSFANNLLPSSHFCPAKLLFLSCHAAISVMPSSHFCSAKLPYLSCQAN